MSEITTKLGENAGKLWTILNKNGSLKKDDILEVTKLSEKDFFSAVGWLARENKVSRQDDDSFKLDNTNIGHEIGTHAGRVWKILDIWEDVDIDSIKTLSDLDDTQVHSALGWLAREDKIIVDEKNRFKLK
ncbi:MAG: winged helix-turn-helix domain-containing protein [Candidatus Thermoplasmatota archaeon]|nr:winged helix-turn-helix domain-containing protein [Candidatus Thermoplasmatota archaeon]